jgi:hypothetical protein
MTRITNLSGLGPESCRWRLPVQADRDSAQFLRYSGV